MAEVTLPEKFVLGIDKDVVANMTDAQFDALSEATGARVLVDILKTAAKLPTPASVMSEHSKIVVDWSKSSK